MLLSTKTEDKLDIVFELCIYCLKSLNITYNVHLPLFHSGSEMRKIL